MFLRDDDISDIILYTKTGRVIVDIEFNKEDLCPILSLNNGDLIPEGGSITIHKNTTPKSTVITVDNAEIYTEIYWLYNGVQHSLTDEATFTANTEEEPFLFVKTYFITVVGITDDEKAYGTTFNILVVS